MTTEEEFVRDCCKSAMISSTSGKFVVTRTVELWDGRSFQDELGSGETADEAWAKSSQNIKERSKRQRGRL